MKTIRELALKPGETVSVDGIRDGIARLVIGTEGDRVETVAADELPEGAREAGAILTVTEGGSLTREGAKEKSVGEETSDLMAEIFGEPPPE